MSGAADPELARWQFDAIGTSWTIETERPLSDSTRRSVIEVIAEFDRAWSRFRSDSMVSVLGALGGRVRAPEDAEAMLSRYRELSDSTNGAVNPLVGASLEALGYDREYSFSESSPVPAPTNWPELLSVQGGELTLTVPATVDVGAIGKGRLVDKVLTHLEAADLGDLIVDASGDLAVRGRSHRVGLEHPRDPRRAIGVATITDQALCASAIGRRAWGNGFHHVLDARTGTPVRTIAATWAIASDAMLADAACTALFFAGGPALAYQWGVHWVRMSTSGTVEWSPECPVELFR